MSLCINPHCYKPSNDDNHLFCQSCGSELLLHGLYRVCRELGGGGFGKTYEVAEGDTLKVLKVLTLNNPIALRLFQQEAEVLKKLNHPGIPKVEADGYFEFFPKGSQDPLHCIVMEKIEGENLEAYLEKRGQPIHQKLALKWLMEIAEILYQVHQQGFLHRDIKPANIMLRPDGQLALIDFGTVKEITVTLMSSEAKRQGTGVYTVGYAPPEQEKGFTVQKSDFFALGRTMVHLLTNKPPLDFYNPETDELEWRGAAPNLSPLLADFLDQLMRRLPKDRPKDTEEILQRLREIEDKLYPPRIPSPPPSPPLSQPLQSATISSSQINNSDKVMSVVISPDGQTIVSGSEEKTIQIWDLATKQLKRTLTGHSDKVRSVAISTDGQTLVSGSWDKTIKIWDLATGHLKRTLKGHSEAVISVAITPSGHTLVSGSRDKTIKIWLATGQLLSTLRGHADAVISVAISPNGQTLVSGSKDNKIKFWLVTGQLLSTLKGHADAVISVAISPDGQILVSGSWDKTVKIWHLATGQLLRTLTGHSYDVNSVAISPDGQTIVSGSYDNTIKIWDLATGKLLRTLTGHSSSVDSVAISPDGQIIVSGSGDNTIKIWRLER